jgi:hypothetical protein
VTTTADLIEETLADLRSGGRELYNEILTAVETTDIALAFSRDIQSIQPGSVISVGLEEMQVWTTDPTAKTAEVKRGWGGTTPVALSGGELVTVNPRFSDARVLRALNRELSALSGDLFQVKTVELTSSPIAWTYNVTASDLIDVYQVFWDSVGPENYWPEAHDWELRRAQDADEFASTNALRFNQYVDPGRQIRVVYKATFSPLETLTDDVETVTGIPASAVDILALGAQMRLMGVRESKRAFTEAQSDTRRAGEVPPGSATRSYSVLAQLRRERIGEERTKLLRQYPVRKP